MRACEGRLGREPKGTGTARLAVGKRQPPLQPRPARRRHAQPPPWIGTAVRGVWPRSFPCIPGTGSIWFQHCWIHAHLATRTFTRSPTACECPAPVKKQASWTTQRPLGTREKWRPDEAQRRLQRREGQAHQRPPHPPLKVGFFFRVPGWSTVFVFRVPGCLASTDRGAHYLHPSSLPGGSPLPCHPAEGGITQHRRYPKISSSLSLSLSFSLGVRAAQCQSRRVRSLAALLCLSALCAVTATHTRYLRVSHCYESVSRAVA